MAYDFELEKPEKKFVGIDATSEDTFTVTNEVVTVYKCPDKTEVIAETAATSEAITDGFRIKYALDSSSLDAGTYIAQFEFDRDGGIEHRVKSVSILIKENTCEC